MTVTPVALKGTKAKTISQASNSDKYIQKSIAFAASGHSELPLAMSLSPPNHLQLRSRLPSSSSPLLFSACLGNTMASNAAATDAIHVVNLQTIEDAKEKIRKMFEKVELSVSAYDTAWVAMAPSPSSPHIPCFPGSVDWILKNQFQDGSWGLPYRNSSLVKDVLSSTLACVLALKKWGVGEEQMRKGLDFISSNFASVMDEEQLSPIGFDIVFPSMIQVAAEMDIDLHLTQTDINAVLRRKDIEIKRINEKRSKTRNFYLTYISEGMGKSQDWEMAMTYQRKNGSLLNSPSATAAAFSHIQDPHCYSYLCSALQQFGNAVPTIFPLDVYSQLYLVDTIEKLGIDRHFKENIRSVLNEIFGHWEQGHEEIFSDPLTCKMAFQLLREHGYDVSSESLAIDQCEDWYFDRFGGHLEDIRSALELFKASQLLIYPRESYLDDYASRAKHFLEQEISENPLQGDDGYRRYMIQEVVDTLKSPYHASLERLVSRQYVEHYNLDNTRILKTSLCHTNLCNKAFLQLATEDFNYCQSVHLQEFKQLQRWLIESKLDQLSFSRQKLGYCYFSAAATLFSPELADARLSWAKNGVVTTVVDDFFDVGSSEEEQLNLIQLVEKWDGNLSIGSCSEKVAIIFSALRSTICELGEKAYALQNRSITDHIVEIWLNLLRSMWEEAEMVRSNSVPTMAEYMENGYVSFALGPIVLPALYFIGPKLSEQVIRSDDYHHLFELMSTCGRLLNDIQGFQRESAEGKLNAVSLHLLHSGGTINKEEAIRELRWIIDDKRRELLRQVLRGDDSVFPRECRDVFWKMCKVLHLFYVKDDGFTSQEMESTVKALLYHPIESRI